MITFNQFLQILSEKKLSKKQQKEISKGIVVKPKNVQTDADGTKSYNLRDVPKPVYTNPGSAERKAQINIIQKNSGAKAFN